MEIEKIGKAHEYTHKKEFEEEITNEDIRYLIRRLMDMVEGLTNIYSNTFERGLIEVDKQKKTRELKQLQEYLATRKTHKR